MTESSPSLAMGKLEFVALIAMMFATIAFSMDAMLPALPEIGAELSPENLQQAALVITSFVFGLGVGTFFTGPLSDAFGRRIIILVGVAIYIAGALVAWAAQSLEVMLIARVFQGLGAAGPRIVAIAIIRDLFTGREMARISSLVMIIFTLFPAIAPLLGAMITNGFGWRAIFLAFVVFGGFVVLWMGTRLPETLAKEARRPMRFALIWSAIKEIFGHPYVRISIMVQALSMGMLFSTLLMVQPIFYEVYDRADTFPYWFAVVSLVAASASILNAALVVRLGMQTMVISMLAVQIALSSAMLFLDLGALPEPFGFFAFLIYQTGLFFQAGLVLGNLNAMAMEPMGHIAGIAASVVSAVSTVIAAAIASPVGLMFDGTVRPLVIAVLALAVMALLLMLLLRRVERPVQSA